MAFVVTWAPGGPVLWVYYYSVRLKKGLNGVFLEWLYTTAATFTPFL